VLAAGRTSAPILARRSAPERLIGELEDGHALLFPSGAGATTALALALLQPGSTVAVADGGW
jgi:cystathionine beta-lyase/cystathionine gamma-synthase